MMTDTCRVLYVDDEPALLEIGKIFLERSGNFSVTTIESAHAALALLRTDTFDAIIADYQMPEIDGLEFLKQVRLHHGLIPFILFTGRGREEVVILALNHGADFYLQKGGDPLAQFTELSHMVRVAIGKRAADTAFKESDEKFRVLSDTTPVAITVYQGTRDVYVNDYAALMTGYSKEELYAMNFWDMIHPDSRELIKERGLARMQGDNTPTMYEVKYVTKSREVRWAYLSTGSITYEGKPAGVATLVDITERKKAESELLSSYEHMAAAEEELREQYDTLKENQQQLQKSEQDYRTILENIQDVYYRTGTEGNLILSSPSLATLLGYSSVSELYGKNISETLYYNPDDRQKILADIRKNGSVADYEVMFKKRDGTPVIISTSSHEYFDAEGNYLGIEGIFRDITGRKRAEESLKQSENLYRTIFEMTGAATIIIEDDTTISLANSGFARLSGFSIEELEDRKSWTEFIVKEDLERMKKYHVDRRDDPPLAPRVYEFRLITRSGEIRHCINNVALIPGTTRSVASVLDITSRVQAEELYQTVFENTGTAMAILDEDTTIVQVNAEMEKIWGYSREEIEGRMKWPQMIVQEDLPKMLEFHHRRRIDPDSAPKSYEFRFIHKNGEIRDASLTAAMIPGTGKSVISLRDISKFKETVKALRDSEAIYQQLESQLPDFVIIHEGETIVFVNAEGARLMGKTPEQIIGTSVLSYAAPEYHGLIKKNTWLRYQGIAVEPYEIEIIAPSGEHRWVVVRSTRLPNRETPSTLTVLTDITERRRAEVALRESEARYRTIIENMQDLVYQTDLQGNLTMVSPAGIRLAGYASPEAVIGRNVARDLYADPKQHEEFLAMLARDGKVNDFPVNLKAGDGTIRYATASSHFYFDANGKRLGIEGVLHDITERIKIEEALRQANQKLHLLSGITRHDINNQLTALSGYLALLEVKIPDPALKVYLLKTRTAADQISSMIQFTKEYEEIGVTTPVWQDIRTLVTLAGKEVPPGLARLDNDLPAGMEVFADPLIGKVFFNLMDNSLRYGGKNTTLRFFAKDRGGDKIVVCEDDGAGVAPPDKEKIFERGFGRNTGLGLALSREILAITGITIAETGEPGTGARFEMTIPGGMWRMGSEKE